MARIPTTIMLECANDDEAQKTIAALNGYVFIAKGLLEVDSKIKKKDVLTVMATKKFLAQK